MPEHGEPEGAPAAPIVYTGILGKLEDFDSKSDTITAYIERAQLFMDANNIPNEKRVLTLLSSIGKTATRLQETC